MKSKNKFTIALALFATVIVVACAAEQVMRTETAITDAQTALDQRKEAATAAGDTATLEAIAKAEENLAQARTILDSMRDPATGEITTDSGIAGGAAAASAFLPPPWNIVALLGAPLIALVGQEIRVRRQAAAAKSIVNSIDVLRATQPAAVTAMAAAKEAMNAQLTPLAKEIVKEETIT